MTPPPPASSSTSRAATTNVPVPAESEVAAVAAAASVRVAVSTSVVAPSVGDAEAVVVADPAVADAVDVVDVLVAEEVGAAVEAFVAPPVEPAAPVLVGRLADVRDALVVDVAGRCVDGGLIAGGLPAPNAQPSTVPAFGWVEAAPTVL
jgi:hypothetical protein